MFNSFSQSFVRAAVGTVGMAVCAGICLGGATVPANAATLDDTIRTRVVSYADLDLSSPAGRAVLDRRIRSAAHAVCQMGSNELAMNNAEYRCVRDAVDGAAPKAIVTADVR